MVNRKGVSAMVSILDVAAYILEKQGAMTRMKLQKLVYYCQAWSLVWAQRISSFDDISQIQAKRDMGSS
jgi:uncharacterized phage-associated protein